jgi:two-component system, repressor protein LuxO
MTTDTHCPILLVEDDSTMARVYVEYLAGDPYDVTHVETGRDALDAMAADVPDIILLDVKLPDMSGFDILRHVGEKGLGSDVIVITGHGSMNVAIEAMQLGARDFLVKPFNKERLLYTLRNTLERQRLDRIVTTYRDEIDRHQYGGFIGSSLSMQGVYRIIDNAARSKATVFITGESGTGKEVCAEAIHAQSARADKPFIAINCSAIPKDLMESEIFGHVKGAFTSAVSNRKGAAGMADGGTLFLDEICEMDPALQPKLLRFLQTGSFVSVGSSQTVSVDVRIICATNRDPLAEVAAGRFREDLYYRLHVLPIDLPPLNEREGDVIEIAKHFLSVYSREENKSFNGFAPEVEATFRRFPWPGNVRQLQNVIRNIVVLNDGEEVLGSMLPAPLDGGAALPLAPTPPVPGAPPVRPVAAAAAQSKSDESTIIPLAELEREAIEMAVSICEGNVPRAAHFLGISAATIYRKRAAWKEMQDLKASPA